MMPEGTYTREYRTMSNQESEFWGFYNSGDIQFQAALEGITKGLRPFNKTVIKTALAAEKKEETVFDAPDENENLKGLKKYIVKKMLEEAEYGSDEEMKKIRKSIQGNVGNWLTYESYNLTKEDEKINMLRFCFALKMSKEEATSFFDKAFHVPCFTRTPMDLIFEYALENGKSWSHAKKLYERYKECISKKYDSTFAGLYSKKSEILPDEMLFLISEKVWNCHSFDVLALSFLQPSEPSCDVVEKLKGQNLTEFLKNKIERRINKSINDEHGSVSDDENESSKQVSEATDRIAMRVIDSICNLVGEDVAKRRNINRFVSNDRIINWQGGKNSPNFIDSFTDRLFLFALLDSGYIDRVDFRDIIIMSYLHKATPKGGSKAKCINSQQLAAWITKNLPDRDMPLANIEDVVLFNYFFAGSDKPGKVKKSRSSGAESETVKEIKRISALQLRNTSTIRSEISSLDDDSLIDYLINSNRQFFIANVKAIKKIEFYTNEISQMREFTEKIEGTAGKVERFSTFVQDLFERINATENTGYVLMWIYITLAFGLDESYDVVFNSAQKRIDRKVLKSEITNQYLLNFVISQMGSYKIAVEEITSDEKHWINRFIDDQPVYDTYLRGRGIGGDVLNELDTMMNKISNQYFDSKKLNSGAVDFLAKGYASVPQPHFLENEEFTVKKKNQFSKYNELRSMLVLLYFFYYWIQYTKQKSANKSGKPGVGNKEEYVKRFEFEVNCLLAECGFHSIYPPNPLDFIILSASSSKNPIAFFSQLFFKVSDCQKPAKVIKKQQASKTKQNKTK